MLENYLKKAQEQHNLNPIHQEEYLAWKESKVTRRFFAEFKEAIIIQIEDIGAAATFDDLARNAVQFKTTHDTYETLKDWTPSEIHGDDS